MSLGNAFKKVRKLVSKKAVIVAAVLAVGISGATAVTQMQAVRADKQDCNNNAVMFCGAFSVSELKSKYDSSASTRAIYAASPFGISSSEFNGSLSSLQNGAVYKNGNVVVNGRVVATGAITAGREYIPGSTNMNIPGVSAYKRPPSVSFKQDYLHAYVKLDAAGNFQFAIIKSCGNPVTGKPTPPPAKPSFTIEKKVRIAGSNSDWKEDVTVTPGQRVEYVIAVANTGNVALTNMSVRDQLPASMSYVKGSTTLVPSYGAKRSLPDGVTGRGINIGTVPVKGTAFVFFLADAPKATNTNLKICETGEKSLLHNVAYAKPAELPEKNNGADVHTCRPGKPSFEIEKKVKISGTKDEYTENVFADPGTLLEFVVAVTNTGDVQLKNMVVTDKLPKGLDYKEGTTRLVTSRGVNKNLPDSPSLFAKGITLTTMEPKETAFIFFQAYLPKADSTDVAVKECSAGHTKLVNIAKAKPAGLNTKEDNASAETCKKTPEFTVQKDVRKKGSSTWAQDVTVNYGETVEYRILVKNTGATDLKNVLVKDNRPTGVDYVNGTLKVNGSSSSADLFGTGVTVPEIKKGAQAEITFDAKLMGQPEECVNQSFKNIASAKPAGLEPKDDDAIVKANCVATHPKVEIEKSVSKPIVDVNGEFTYTLNVKNTGDVTLKNVKVTDAAPEGVEFLSAEGPDNTDFDVTATQFSASIPSLGVGETVTYTIQSKVVKQVAGAITNTACVDTPETPKNPDDCDTVDIHTPSYKCVSLASLGLGDFRYRFTPQVAVDKASVSSVNYNFGDGSEPVTVAGLTSAEHTFVQTEQKVAYTVVATVTFNVDGVSKNDTCSAQVEISPIPEEPCPYNPDLPKDSPDCVKDVCPEMPGTQTNPKDCEQQPPVPVIPSTGAGSVAGGAAGLSAAAYGAVMFLNKRRGIKNLN